MNIKFKDLRNSALLVKSCGDQLYPVPYILVQRKFILWQKIASKMQFVSCQFILTWRCWGVMFTYHLLFSDRFWMNSLLWAVSIVMVSIAN